VNGEDALERINEAVAARDAAGLRREICPRRKWDTVLDLASNDYLGLTHHTKVTHAAMDAAIDWGAGATGSRLVTGSTELHHALEEALAHFTGAARALVFSSGYLANIGAVGALGGPNVTVISDRGNHASLIDACRLSRSPTAVVPHRDLAAIERALATARTPHALVVTDSVFSVDGDLAPLRQIHQIVRRHKAILVVDEAHALGVVGPEGRGGVAAAGLTGAADVVQTATLSKSLGAQGGAVLGAAPVIELVLSTARSFIFDTGLAPTSAGAALAALGVLIEEPWRATAVRLRATQLASAVAELGLETVVPNAAVVPAYIGDPGKAMLAAAVCLDNGMRVGCFRPPSVPSGRSCLRLTARATLTDADIDRAASVLRSARDAVFGRVGA
jgi:8-amino-7-oxononanoate synthase